MVSFSVKLVTIHLYSGYSRYLDLFITDVALLWSDWQHVQAHHKNQIHLSLTVLWKFGLSCQVVHLLSANKHSLGNTYIDAYVHTYMHKYINWPSVSICISSIQSLQNDHKVKKVYVLMVHTLNSPSVSLA